MASSILRGAAVFGVLCAAGLAPIDLALADDPVSEARETAALFRKADPSLQRFFETAIGYAVLPSVGKGGLVVGGAFGKGVLFERGKATGEVALAQMTVGLQLGGQAYSEVIFFETDAALDGFKNGDFAFAAQLSAVAVASGAAAHAKYRQGVAVFTLAKGGLMGEASVGGQKFEYRPYQKKSK